MKMSTNTDQRINAPITSQESSTNRDRKQILALLRLKPIHTIEFRELHGLISPAPRIKELRERGYNIRTKLIRAMSQDGRVHNNVALYVLVSEPSAANRTEGAAA
ncbi:helix-turn-helix domain-containing protein [Glaciecola petra]|uniref:Helix-turn-helix domain-containing protein n=1 Tax=Glaciecola petra TaxID=3075602 RepID=A0ABU2ZTX6_9ALTE|nr:helix-turn-helix domain-containing protein [Aestuariibacter sp. P117]MDT0596100.1 helix-turn-helix domain-containing protein [Aestuariibacter sp. P117]